MQTEREMNLENALCDAIGAMRAARDLGTVAEDVSRSDVIRLLDDAIAAGRKALAAHITA